MKYYFLLILAFILLGLCSGAQEWHPNPQFMRDTTHKKNTTYQCMGTTKQGTRCKKRVKENGGYCAIHAYQRPSPFKGE